MKCIMLCVELHWVAPVAWVGHTTPLVYCVILWASWGGLSAV